MTGNTCQFCGKPLWRAKRGSEGFCSQEHRDRYRAKRSLDRLNESGEAAARNRRREQPNIAALQRPACPPEMQQRRSYPGKNPLSFQAGDCFTPHVSIAKSRSVPGCGPAMLVSARGNGAAARKFFGSPAFAIRQPLAGLQRPSWSIAGARERRPRHATDFRPPAASGSCVLARHRLPQSPVWALRPPLVARRRVPKPGGPLKCGTTSAGSEKAAALPVAIRPVTVAAKRRDFAGACRMLSDMRPRGIRTWATGLAVAGAGASILEGSTDPLVLALKARVPVQRSAPVTCAFSLAPVKLAGTMTLDGPSSAGLAHAGQAHRVTLVARPLAPRAMAACEGELSPPDLIYPVTQYTVSGGRLTPCKSAAAQAAACPPPATQARLCPEARTHTKRPRTREHRKEVVSASTLDFPGEMPESIPPCDSATVGRPAEIAFFMHDCFFRSASLEPAGSLREMLGDQAIAEAMRLEENFESGLERWSGAQDWRLDVAGVRVKSPAFLQPSMSMRDYKVEFLAMVENQGVGCAFRATDTANYWALKLAVEDGAVVLHRYAVINGEAEAPVSVPLEGVRAKAAATVQITAGRDAFTVTVDGRAVDKWKDARLPQGGIGFFAGGTRPARLYWVRLYPEVSSLPE